MDKMCRGVDMTKGQMEAKISEAVSKFEIEYMGRGPKEIKTLISQDLIIIRIKGFLSISEQRLAETNHGIKLIKEMRTALFESAREYLESVINPVIHANVVSTYCDVSTKTGEKIIVITVDKILDS